MKSPFLPSLFRRGLVLALAVCPLATGVRSAAALTVDTLRCESIDGTMGIDSPTPSLSWLPRSTTRGESVTAYQVQVSSSQANLTAGIGDLWDSGKVASSENTQIAYAGSPLSSWQQVFWQVRLWNGAGAVSAWSSPATWTMGVLNASDWTAQWITPSAAATDVGSSLLRHEFTVNGGLVKALVNVTGLGQYEMSLNGSRVGTDLLSPGWTTYGKTVLYDTYDITSMLQSGTNAVGVMLGNGMYNVPSSSRYAKFTGTVGPRQAIVQIRLIYSNGTVQTIGSDGTWKWSNGPITFNTTYGGEDYDARLDQAGWNVAGFNDSAWSAVTVGNGPGGTLRGASYAAPPLRKQVEVFQPTPAIVPTASTTVYDFVQNASNMPTLTVYGPAGATVKLWYSEVGTAGSPGSISQINSPSWATYTLKGSTSSAPETFTPHFVCIGYRYLEVDLAGGATVVSLTSSPVHTSSDATGNFTSSSTLFNNTRLITRWAQRSNLVSLITDCPTREKLGWQEQYHLHGPSLRYEFDLQALYRKTYTDQGDSQQSNGMAPSISPEFTVFGGAFRDSPEWGSACVLSPQQQYDFYEDQAAISRYYPNMKRYVDYLSTQASGYIVNYGLGDWYDIGPNPPGYSQLTPSGLTATAMYYADAQAVATMAQMLGNPSDAATYTTLASNIQTAFNSQFYNSAAGNYGSGSQTSDAMPLALGLVPAANKQTVLNALVAQVRQDGNSVTAGDIGHRYLLRALADGGRSDVVFDIHSKLTNPGYGYILSLGNTALTEGWDGSNSKDHFMLGHIMEWFYHDLVGIQSDPAGPGFKKIIIKPSVVGDLTSASATYQSVRGPITSAWNLSGSQLSLNVTIPPGTTASVYLPLLATNTATLNVTESGTAILQNGAATGSVAGVGFLGFTTGTPGQCYAEWSVGSGTYQFSWQFTPAPPSGLTVVAGPAQNALTWTAVPGASSYNVKRATVSGGPYQTVASGTNGTSFTDSGLQNGTPFFYVVSAMVNGVETGNSDEAQGTPSFNFGFEYPSISTYQYNPPGAAWTFSAQSGANGSGISANGSGFTGSNAAAPEGKQVAFLQGLGTITQTLNGLLPGANYLVTFSGAQRVSTNGNGQTWQVKLDGAVIGTYAPAQSATAYVDYTATFTATSTAHTLSFVGTDTRGGDNTVFLDNVRLTVVANKLSGTIIGTPGSWGNAGSTIAKAFDGDVTTFFDSPTSTGWAGLDLGTTPAVITQVRSCPRQDQPGRMVGGVFQGANSADFSNAVTLFTVASTPATGVLTAQAISSSTPFRYVRYLGPANSYGNVAELEFDGFASPPLIPTGLAATAGFQQVSLTWNPAPGAAAYQLKRSSGGGAFATLSAAPATPGFVDTGLSDGTAYSYRVFATNGTGSSADSNTASATPAAPPVTAQEQAAPALALTGQAGANGSASCTVGLSVVGHTYQLQYVDDLASGAWQAVPGVAAQAGTGAALQFNVPMDASVQHCFYRLAITLQ